MMITPHIFLQNTPAFLRFTFAIVYGPYMGAWRDRCFYVIRGTLADWLNHLIETTPTLSSIHI